jgi:hypothetical protein
MNSNAVNGQPRKYYLFYLKKSNNQLQERVVSMSTHTHTIEIYTRTANERKVSFT